MERLHSIQSKHNEEVLRAVVSSRSVAIDFIAQRVQEHGIDCEFVRAPWHLFTTPETSSHSQEVEKELKAAQTAGLPATGETPEGFPFQVDTIVSIANQAQFNPLKYVQGLAAAIIGENCQIYEGTKVTNVEDGEPCVIHTQQGKVKAKYVVMATHSPKGIYAVHTAMEPKREYGLCG